MKNINSIKWITGIVVTVIVLGIIYSTFFRSQYGYGNDTLIFVTGALLLGALIMFLVNKAFLSGSQKVEIKESSHTVIESMRKVFKIVTAEGQFNEIYNYEESSKIFGIIPTHKKALVIVTAKALIGYDFEKCKWEIDEHQKKITLISFPHPEILSLDTDYKYYNIEENLLNKFSRDDLAKIQSNGKQQVILAARNSHLPQVAAEQMITLLTEIIYSKEWKVENLKLIKENKSMALSAPRESETTGNPSSL